MKIRKRKLCPGKGKKEGIRLKLKNKNKVFIIALMAVILILFLVIIPMFWKRQNDSKRVIAINWGIRIPDTSEEIYEKESPAGFHGDNDRYHIFKIKEDQQTTDFITNMNTGNHPGLQEYVRTILKTLEIPEEYSPQMEQKPKWILYSKNEWDKIAVLYMEKEQRLYVIEHFQ